jgi:hypothetical protein
VRYFITEAPLLTDWVIFNKDIGPAEFNRDRYRIGIGVRGDQPIADVTLYDGFQVARRWSPGKDTFAASVDGRHDGQHMYMLVASDRHGRRVVSPQIRTVTRNYRLRCGDRQNWLGTQPPWTIYPGWRQVYGTFIVRLRNAVESNVPAPIFDFPFFSNHMVMVDTDGSKKYIDTIGKVYGDAAPTQAVRDRDILETQVRTLHVNPDKTRDLGIMRVDARLRLRRDVEPVLDSPVFPGVFRAAGGNKLLILPDQPAREMEAGLRVDDLPVGTYAGGWIVLTPGLRLAGDAVGFPAPPAHTLTLAKGSEWSARYLRLNSGALTWRKNLDASGMDERAEDLLRFMGFRAGTPYRFDLTRGKLDALGYFATFDGSEGGIAGRCLNPDSETVPYLVPLEIRGLSRRVPAALWRSDKDGLEWFGVFHDTGYVSFNADSDVRFYAGNVATCHPALFVSVLDWTADSARFRLNNPTEQAITTAFATAPEIEGLRPLGTTLTVPPGSSAEIP